MDRALKVGITLIIIASVAIAGLFIGLEKFVVAPAPSGTTTSSTVYSNNLLVSYNINDQTKGKSLFEAANISPMWYSATASPFSITSTDVALGYASNYVSSVHAWESNPAAGSYELVIQGNSTYYPSLTDVTVPTTTEISSTTGQAISTVNPSSFSLVERASPTIIDNIFVYDSSTGLYDIAQGNLHTSNCTKAQITYKISVGGSNGQVLEAGDLYLPAITGSTITSVTASWDNGQTVTPTLDTTGAITGLTGYYITFPQLNAGQSYTVVVDRTLTSTATDGTYSAYLHDAANIENPTFRTWIDATANLVVTT